jgi:hypothetical protein
MKVIIDEVNDCNKKTYILRHFFNKDIRDIGIQCVKSNLCIITMKYHKYAHINIVAASLLQI